MKLRTERRGRRRTLAAVSDNGHRETVLSRACPKTLEAAELALLHALARKHGLKLVPYDMWAYQIDVAARAHSELVALRRARPPVDNAGSTA